MGTASSATARERREPSRPRSWDCSPRRHAIGIHYFSAHATDAVTGGHHAASMALGAPSTVEACRSCPAATFSIVQLVEMMYVSLTCCANSCRVYGLVRSMRHSGL